MAGSITKTTFSESGSLGNELYARTASVGISWPRLLFAIFTSFSIIYNISFLPNESLSTGRLAVVLLFFWFLVFDHWKYKSFDWRIIIIFLPVPYVIAQLWFSRDFGQSSRFFHLALFSYAGGFLIYRLSGSLDTLLAVMLSVIGIQSVVLLLSFVSIEYRVWVGSIVATSANFDASNIYRAPGFTSSAGSALSVIQSLGVMVGGLFLFRRRASLSARRVHFVLLLMILCALSCVVVGRTGLVLSAIFFCLFLRVSGISIAFLRVIIGVVVPVVGVILVYLEDILPSDFSIEYFSGWAFGFLTGNDQTSENLASMPIGDVSIDTLLGSGLVSIVDGANPSGHDSGFIQNYFSMGLVNTIILYLAYLIVLFRLLFWLPGYIRFALTLLFFLIDIKEPFLFKYAVMFVLVSTYLAAREEIGSSRDQP